MTKTLTLVAVFHGGRKILAPERSRKAELLFVGFTCRNSVRGVTKSRRKQSPAKLGNYKILVKLRET